MSSEKRKALAEMYGDMAADERECYDQLLEWCILIMANRLGIKHNYDLMDPRQAATFYIRLLPNSEINLEYKEMFEDMEDEQ